MLLSGLTTWRQTIQRRKPLLNKIKPDYPKSGQQHAVPEWKEVVGGHFPKLAPAVEACLANVCALLLKDLSTCPSLVLVGPPSSVKTTPLDFIDTTFIYISDNFTTAFLSVMRLMLNEINWRQTSIFCPSLRAKRLW